MYIVQTSNAIPLSCNSSSGMLSYEKKEFPVIDIIGKVFPKGKIGLLYGESGIGKTTTAIKMLNSEGIEPILVDFDDNPSPADMKTNHIPIDGFKLINHDHNEKKLDIPSDAVIIVDTYAYSRVASVVKDKDGNTIDRFEGFIAGLNKSGSNTIIIVAHNKEYATEKSIPDADAIWVNHLGFKLWLHEDKVEKPQDNLTGRIKRLPAVVLTIKKLRGYTGSRDIFIRWL